MGGRRGGVGWRRGLAAKDYKQGEAKEGEEGKRKKRFNRQSSCLTRQPVRRVRLTRCYIGATYFVRGGGGGEEEPGGSKRTD